MGPRFQGNLSEEYVWQHSYLLAQVRGTNIAIFTASNIFNVCSYLMKLYEVFS